jgi:hypothetical protein
MENTMSHHVTVKSAGTIVQEESSVYFGSFEECCAFCEGYIAAMDSNLGYSVEYIRDSDGTVVAALLEARSIATSSIVLEVLEGTPEDPDDDLFLDLASEDPVEEYVN